jgi:hypothetical protein
MNCEVRGLDFEAQRVRLERVHFLKAASTSVTTLCIGLSRSQAQGPKEGCCIYHA